jgi:PAS domain S-box-containing protein
MMQDHEKKGTKPPSVKPDLTGVSLPEKNSSGDSGDGTQTARTGENGSAKAATIRVLYVDDEPSLLEIGKLYLERSGDFEVTTILKASEAILLLQQEKFDAIISDYQMPEMDGLQFLVEVRARIGQIPFILFTARGREVVIVQAINSGADAYIQKGGEPKAMFAELAHRIRWATSRKEARDSLRKREEEYRYLVEHSDEAIVVIQDGMLRLINYRTVARTGYSEQELMSMPFPLLVHPDDRAKVVERYQKRMKGEDTPSQYSFRLIGKDGSTIWVEISTVTITWEGRPATINFLIDITDRKWAEEMITRTRRNYEAFFNTINEFLFVLDEQGRILHTNETVTRRLGYTMEELVGQPVLIVHPPDRWEEAGCTVQGMLAGTMDFCPVPLMTKTGQLIPVETRVTKGEWDGKPVIFGVSKDISKLKLSEEKFSVAFRSNASPMALSTKADGKFIEVNEAFLELLGFSRDEVIGKRARDMGLFVQTEDRSNALRLLDKNEPIRNLELTIRAKDGSLRYGLFSADNITIGEVACLLTSLVDITGRRQMEEALRESRQILEGILNSIPVSVFWKNKELTYLGCNMPFARDAGFERPEDVIGKDDYSMGWREQAELYRADDRAVIESGRSKLQIEEPQTTPAGKNIFILTSKLPLLDIKGDAIGVLGTYLDITERKLAEEALRESEARYRALSEESPDQIFINSRDGTIQYVNSAVLKLFNRPRDQVIGKLAKNLFPPEIVKAQEANRQKIFETGECVHTEDLIQFGDEKLWIDVHLMPLQNQMGNVTSILGIARDITQRKQAEAVISLMSKKLAILSSITRHDINNQLAGILGYLDMLKSEVHDTSLDEYFQTLSESARQILVMIQFAKDYELIGVNAPVWQNCHTLVETAAKEASLGKVMVKNDLPAHAEVFADPLIEKVFYTLIDNAVRYGGKITTIRFSADESGDEDLIVCEDDGEGVVAEEKEKIFERGFGKHTGLGLALAREILTITGITVREKGIPGTGARFEMTVPKGMFR